MADAVIEAQKLIDKTRQKTIPQPKKNKCIAPINGIGKLPSKFHSIYYRFSGETDVHNSLFFKASAKDILSRPVNASVLFSDRIVVIGGSYAEGRDIHATPLGSMPGAIVISNTISTSYLLIDNQKGHAWVSMLLSLSMCVVILIFLRFLKPFPVAIIVFVFYIVAVPLGIRLFHYPQILSSFTDTIVILSVVQGIRALIEITLDIRHKGWKALLKG